ncbi:Cellulose synthase like G3, putative [Theobroma cacao]|uniref:Cellulose synthase like G3, putative n=1 Tax=Theobroma cacao TaxID=3641 RepID=A0A061G6P4_THECC|nr:Cellulose synthase like G3, putative [Theobroma cacao]
MGGRGLIAGRTAHAPPLHKFEPLRRTALNRLFAAVYASAIIALLYRHAQTLIYSATSLLSFSLSLSLLISDLVLAFMWTGAQAFRVCPIRRKEFPENLRKIIKEEDFPGLDVFICTADPYKEPPMNVVNTALSLMAYDYPTEKISVYVSDDGGSAFTLFAFMEAAKFASHWLPFCREHNMMERSPEVYFASTYHSWSPEIEKIKMMYEIMKVKVKHIVDKGEISDEYIVDNEYREVFRKWTDGFTRMDHPAVVQVILDKSKDKDISGNFLPNLIYVSRQKSKTSPHHFKAGALNVLLRVSAVMTNAPLILTQDCDMYSNDPQTPLRVLCYLSDPALQSKLAYIQFPQRFHGLNQTDIYASEYKRLFQINPMGFNGLMGPNYVGSGCFFCRRAFFGGPSTLVPPKIPELSPDHVVDKPINSQKILSLAHNVAGCDYENQTEHWGSKNGFRYGSLVEDFYTGYRLQSEGWKSLFCHPERAAFLGDVPITFLDLLSQCKRWCIGLLEVTFSKYNTLIFGSRSMGIMMGLAYSHYAFWPIWCIPITLYSFLPQLALLNKVSIFPKVSEPWCFLYVFLFLGAYGQDFLDFVLAGGTVRRWWNAQRMWMIRGLSCFLLSSVEYLLKSLGISTHSFSLTSKVLDDEQSKRYDQSIFEFGVPSPLFVPLTMAAIINLFSFAWGLTEFWDNGSNKEGLALQMVLAGFIVLNCLPIYGAIALRSDKGKMPTQITVISTFLSVALYIFAYLILKQ